MARIEIYKSSRPRRTGGGWRWRYVAGNNRKLATGSEGYNNYDDLIVSMIEVCRLSPESQDWVQLPLDGNDMSWSVARLDGTDVTVVKQA